MKLTTQLSFLPMLRMSGSVLLLPLYVFMVLTWTNLLRNPGEMRTEYLKNVCFYRSVIDTTGHFPGWIFSKGTILLCFPRRSCRFCKEHPFLRTASWNSLEQKWPGRGLLTDLHILTLRRLMSYIYMEHPFLMFLDHTQRGSTVGRTPLDE